MADKDMVIKSIENCLHEKECDDCSYEGCIHAHGNCIGDLMANALELLKEQPKQQFFVDSAGKITPLPIQPQWISVNDRMPKTEQKVLVSIKTAYGNRYTTVAAHVGYHERNSESDGWSLECEIDWDEYDEENDWYWVPECWYEVNFVDDNTNWIIDKVDGEITHWMPLPKPPKEVKQDGGQE